MSHPSVSVIVPTYNHEVFVLDTLASVFAQTFTDYEVIVINDGSPDGTADVLRPWIEAGRIRYVAQENQGQAAARNHGIHLAQGEFIALLDDDDLWPAEKLKTQVELLAEHPGAVMVYGTAARLEEPSSIICTETPAGDLRAYFRERNCLTSPGQALIRTEALRQAGGFDPAIWGADDWEMYARLARMGEVLYTETVALLYRSHPANASKNVWKLYSNCLQVQRKHFGRVPVLRDWGAWSRCRRFINNLFFDGCVDTARLLAAQGRRREARQIWLTILPLRPRALKNQQICKSVLAALLPMKAV